MMYFGQKRGKNSRIKHAIFIPLAIAAGVFIFGWVVMQLWNGILPTVLGVNTITFWQALGILVLSKILFGGFKGGQRRPYSHQTHKQDFFNRWMHMSREEREKMRTEWKDRCEPEAKQE
jgi:Ca2+/H+ antiporter, TMEM165/GDT1 family